MLKNVIDIDPVLRTEITKFFNGRAGQHLIEILESQTPQPETVPAVGGSYAPEHIYHIRAGVTQGYMDCLFNLRYIPEMLTDEELENSTPTQENE